jgi:hypothetical protein
MDPKHYTYLCSRRYFRNQKNLQHLHPTLLESLGNFMKQNTIQHNVSAFSRVKTDNYLTTNTSEVRQVRKSTRNEIETSKFRIFAKFSTFLHFTFWPLCDVARLPKSSTWASIFTIGFEGRSWAGPTGTIFGALWALNYFEENYKVGNLRTFLLWR